MKTILVKNFLISAVVACDHFFGKQFLKAVVIFAFRLLFRKKEKMSFSKDLVKTDNVQVTLAEAEGNFKIIAGVNFPIGGGPLAGVAGFKLNSEFDVSGAQLVDVGIVAAEAEFKNVPAIVSALEGLRALIAMEKSKI